MTGIVGAATTGAGFNPSGFAVYDGAVLFSGVDTSGHLELWETDGTVAGTTELNPSSATQSLGLSPADLTALSHADVPLPAETPTSEILWQNANGRAAIWETNGTDVISETAVGANPGPSWKVIGTGDFGHSDILWQRTNGQAAIWEMNGTDVTGEAAVGANPGPSWKVIGTGDFNDDGHSDILWQNASGQAAIWEMNGTNVISETAVGANPGPSWRAVQLT